MLDKLDADRPGDFESPLCFVSTTVDSVISDGNVNTECYPVSRTADTPAHASESFGPESLGDF